MTPMSLGVRGWKSKMVKTGWGDLIQCTKSINSVLTSIKTGLNIFINEKSPKMLQTGPFGGPETPRWAVRNIKKKFKGRRKFQTNAPKQSFPFLYDLEGVFRPKHGKTLYSYCFPIHFL